MCCIDKNASVLWSDDGFDNGSEIIDIGKDLYAKKNVIKAGLLARRIFRSSNNWNTLVPPSKRAAKLAHRAMV